MKFWKMGISFVLAMVFLGAGTVFAADNPGVVVDMSSDRKTAKITIKNVPNTTCSAQVELKTFSNGSSYTVRPDNTAYFCEIRSSEDSVIVYLDYPSSIVKDDKIQVGIISSEQVFTVDSTAKLLLVDEKLQKKEYEASVTVIKQSNSSSSSGGGGGGSSTPATKKPSVQASSNGTVKVSSDGKTVTITPKEGYKVKELLINGKSVGAVTEYTFDKVDENSTVKVIYEPIKEEKEITPVTPTTPTEENKQQPVNETAIFTDVPQNYWASKSISFAVSNGLFFGTEKDKFSPNQNMTRAMFVTVLSRFETAFGEKFKVEAPQMAVYKDVLAGTWYDQAVAWAGGTGIVSGTGDSSFSPDAPVTREQIAVILVNFADKCNIELPKKEEPIAFTDTDKISSWALSAVSKVQQAGILYGKDGGNLEPQAFATRAEVAAMLERFIENINSVQ